MTFLFSIIVLVPTLSCGNTDGAAPHQLHLASYVTCCDIIIAIRYVHCPLDDRFVCTCDKEVDVDLFVCFIA